MEEEPYIEFKNGQGPYMSDTQLNQLQKLIKADIKQQIIDAKNEIQDDIQDIQEDIKRSIASKTFGRQNITVNTSWGSSKVVLDTFDSTTNKLTNTTNGIKIGAGVSKILVSAQSGGVGTNTVSGDKQLMIKKRN